MTTRRSRPATTPPTLRQMRAVAPWLWLYCRRCTHRRAVTIARYEIVWGLDASSDRLRALSVCSECGSLGAQTVAPSYYDAITGFSWFPAGRETE